MRAVFLISMLWVASSIADGDYPVFGWVNACSEFQEEDEAAGLVSELESLGFPRSGYLMATEWPSISGYTGWLVYTGPFENAEDARSDACRLLWMFPDIESVLVSEEADSRTSVPVPRDLSELMGLAPPTQDFMYESPVPGQWNTVWQQEGSGEEWEVPVRITSQPPGWLVDEWEDIYAGTVEFRAVMLTDDPCERLQRVRDLLRSASPLLGTDVVMDSHDAILLHRLPDPADRKGDWDCWACAADEGLEFGLRVRSFYGEPLYSWDNIPDSARATSLPEYPGNWRDAGEMLLERLESTGAYSAETLENISLSPGYTDGMHDDAWRDYFDLTVREVHRPGGEGDPATAPVLDRFRVYARGNEILWWHPLFGQYLPFSSLLEFDPVSP